MTFGQLRCIVIQRSGAKDMFDFQNFGPQHRQFWEDMNKAEYDRGYTSSYANVGTPALSNMNLLSNTEFDGWLLRFEKFGAKPKSKKTKR
ncbi:MAG: hypothetical protein Q7S28_02330 [bacterium]|nr:hypothetical protein [bacterium]